MPERLQHFHSLALSDDPCHYTSVQALHINKLLRRPLSLLATNFVAVLAFLWLSLGLAPIF